MKSNVNLRSVKATQAQLLRIVGSGKPPRNVVEMEFTPLICRQIMPFNTLNRYRSAKVSDRYSRSMAVGRFYNTGQAIIFGSDGTVLDGQHRLAACIKSGKPFTSLVVFGVNPAFRRYIDTNRSRSASDIFKLTLGIKHSNDTASACALIWKYDNLGVFESSGAGPSPDEMIRTVYETTPDIDDTVQQHADWYKIKSVKLPRSISTALHIVFRRADKTLADTFFSNLYNGEPCQHTDALRSILMASYADTLPVEFTYGGNKKTLRLALVIKTWNAFATNIPIQNLTFRPGDAFPEIVGIKEPLRRSHK